MRLSKSQQHARAMIEDAAARELPISLLGSAIVDALGEAIPNDGFRLLGIDNQTLLVNRLVAASDNDDWARNEWLREVYLRADPIPYIELHELMRMGVTAAASHEQQAECWGIPRHALETVDPLRHAEAFHELRSPTGGTLFGCFHAGGRWVAALQIYRRDGAGGFRKTEVAFLDSMSRGIGSALASAVRRDALAAIDPEADAPATGVVALDPSGRRLFQTPAGERWLAALDGSSNRLPEAVLAAIAVASSGDDGSGTIRAQSSLGPVRVEASKTGDGSFAVVFAPATPPAGIILPMDWELTDAETRVVELALKGLDNAQIAERLFTSPETTRTHLRHVYEKLGVRNRNQLMARYFRSSLDSTTPGLE